VIVEAKDPLKIHHQGGSRSEARMIERISWGKEGLNLLEILVGVTIRVLGFNGFQGGLVSARIHISLSVPV